ncbi:MAG: hypothetical protein MRQ11_06105 [Candidatus Midichloria mitochondrii]|uniref:hypothetical protein n=1 Tax=Candidatus Midichloria mitochondrii TaxID=234827 RepID=UPI0002D974F9|nr:hypothetical protein [Candidatus Midichloria mitochondrii]MDJ1256989.1 hypothetical protein [Candidatus Midichloria mitochondrii]MDJ1288750.1 hypothetical protein [Candidatus Midichloria mitochondrii]MDJ1299570.1 hypothetical protein [Candidatus Midichloria mitochondrii]MDJ1313656.1 hypothetical protein [Candidatus Midichloria mitochondrii]MDJ1584229.1 hypothetical protein [Candidatus Midichloria mitochondrii]
MAEKITELKAVIIEPIKSDSVLGAGLNLLITIPARYCYSSFSWVTKLGKF